MKDRDLRIGRWRFSAEELKRNLITGVIVIAIAVSIGKLFNLGQRHPRSIYRFGKKRTPAAAVSRTDVVLSPEEGELTGLVDKYKTEFTEAITDRVVSTYKEEYGNKWAVRMKKDLGDQAVSIKKVLGEKKYKKTVLELKDEIIAEYKRKYGAAYKRKLKEDYGDAVRDYYKKKYGGGYEEKLREDIIDYYREEDGAGYIEEIKRDFAEEYEEYKKRHPGRKTSE